MQAAEQTEKDIDTDTSGICASRCEYSNLVFLCLGSRQCRSDVSVFIGMVYKYLSLTSIQGAPRAGIENIEEAKVTIVSRQLSCRCSGANVFKNINEHISPSVSIAMSVEVYSKNTNLLFAFLAHCPNSDESKENIKW